MSQGCGSTLGSQVGPTTGDMGPPWGLHGSPMGLHGTPTVGPQRPWRGYQGVCDKDGCDFNSWRLGDQKFYGRGSQGFKVDSRQKVTVVTQFLTEGGAGDHDIDHDPGSITSNQPWG